LDIDGDQCGKSALHDKNIRKCCVLYSHEHLNEVLAMRPEGGAWDDYMESEVHTCADVKVVSWPNWHRSVSAPFCHHGVQANSF